MDVMSRRVCLSLYNYVVGITVLNWLRSAGNHIKIFIYEKVGLKPMEFVNLGLLGLIKRRIEV